MGNHHINIENEQFVVPQRAKTTTLIMIVLGLVLSIIGFFTIKSGASDAKHAINTENTTTIHSSLQQEPQVTNTAAPEHENEAVTTTENAVEETIDSHSTTEHTADHGVAHNDVAHSEEHAPAAHHEKPWQTQVYAAILMNSYYIMLIALGGLFFICVQYVANAGWATALLRIPMAMQTFFIIPAIVVMATIVFGGKDLYHWIAYQAQHLVEGQPGFDAILDAKKWFLNPTFLYIILPALIIVWYIFGRRIMSLSKSEDNEGGTTFFRKSIRTSAAFMVIFGFTFSLLAWLAVMSLDAHWFSTIFGVYHFAILWVCSLTTIMLFTLYLRSQGYLKIITDEHIHDMGKYMFAFCVFWMYIWIAQYLLIWYANIPEESIYYTMRRHTNFDVFFVINIILNFVIPFIAFMTRDAKRNPKVIVVVACSILLGHWIDVYIGIYPGAFNGKVVYPGLLEIGLFLLFAGVFIRWTLVSLTKRSLIAKNHPYIEESATHNVGV